MTIEACRSFITSLRYQMDRKNINARQLTKQAGLGATCVYDILNGKSKNPTLRNIRAIAKALNISTDILLNTTNLDQTDDPAGPSSLLPPYCWYGAPPSISDPNALRCVINHDKRMEPTLSQGDAILIDTDSTPFQNESSNYIFMIHYQGADIFARVTTQNSNNTIYHLSFDHIDYPKKQVSSEEISIHGRVVWWSRWL